MRILIDTQVMLWVAANNLPESARVYTEDKANIFLFSPASLWEIIAQNGLNRSDFFVDVGELYDGMMRAGFGEVAISGRHAVMASTLPRIHDDPFDRIILAQAACEDIPVMTANKRLTQYPGRVILIE